MTQCTTFHPRNFLTMTERTQEIRYQELLREVKNHPNKEELIRLMNEQVADDTSYLAT